MPRPDICVTFDAVEKPGWKMHSIELRVGRLGVGGEEAQRDRRARACCVEVDAGAVVGELDHDFVADLAHRQRDLAGLELAGL